MKGAFAGIVTSFGGFQKIRRFWRSGPGTDEALRGDAMAWLSLLSSGTATVADSDAFKRWYQANPAHAEAYAAAALVWDMLVPIAERNAASMRRLGGSMATRQPVLGRRAFIGGAAVATTAGAACLMLYPPLGLWPSLTDLRGDIRTAVGERRQIGVMNNIAVDLNTRSSVTLPTSTGQVELVAGEAVFSVGATADKSCTIIAGRGRILLPGDASVDVRHDGTEIRVVCLNGTARVQHEARAVNLAAREQVIYDSHAISPAETVDPAVVVAWQQGRLVFRGDSLARVIEEVNRYRSGRIILVDRQLGQRRIDASFQLDRLENVIIYLQQAFDARITSLPGGIVLVG